MQFKYTNDTPHTRPQPLSLAEKFIILINPLKNHRILKIIEMEKPSGNKSAFHQKKNHESNGNIQWMIMNKTINNKLPLCPKCCLMYLYNKVNYRAV